MWRHPGNPYPDEIAELRARIERLEAALDAFSKAVSMPGGPSLAIQRHNPSWTAWKQLCYALARKEGT